MVKKYYLGLMSGTSLDGLDIALMDESTHLLETKYIAYPALLKRALNALCLSKNNSLSIQGRLHRQLGQFYGQAVNTFLKEINIPSQQIEAIGLHGQTICHQVIEAPYYSIQIGSAADVAYLTGITVVNDFRSADIARGGQGAPLAPIFHQTVFMQSMPSIMVVNIGGLANVSFVDNKGELQGFDVGPGNCLLDGWFQCHFDNASYDKGGAWAATGKSDQALLSQLLGDNFFNQLGPKSADKQQFNLTWLNQFLAGKNLKPEDVQATLVALTASLIAKAASQSATQIEKLIVCGGGAKNRAVLYELATFFESVLISDEVGLNSDFVEAMMMAWLARLTIKKERLSLQTITGSKEKAVLGAIYYP